MATLQQKIEHALKTQFLNARDFQACAITLLLPVYPGLSPFSGGTDFGRDADLGGPRLLCTTGTTGGLGALRANLLKSLKSMKDHRIDFSSGIVMATAGRAGAPDRQALGTIAQSHGARLLEVYDRDWLVMQLLKDGYWRRVLVDVTSEPAALVPIPLELRRLGEELPLAGRADELSVLGAQSGDVIVTAAPGVGKTRLLAEVSRVAFLEENPLPGRLGEDLDELLPGVVVVDDAPRRLTDLRLLQRLRAEESRRKFRIAATGWPDEEDSLLDAMPDAQHFRLGLLEVQEVDCIVKSLGVETALFRQAIISQAGGRPGWAVVLAEAARHGAAKEVFDGRTLVRRVERYLRVGEDPTSSLRVLSYLSLYGGVAEGALATFARRLEMPLHVLMQILNSSTHNGVLERTDGGWRVQPEALADALIMRWYLDQDALEPMAALVADYPGELPTLIRAAAEAGIRGSKKGAQLARQYIPQLTTQLSQGDAQALGLCRVFVGMDPAAATWTLEERVLPALKDPRSPESMKPGLWQVVTEAARLYQIPSAVELLLDRAVREGIPANLPENPIRILGETAGKISPDEQVNFGPRRAVFQAALAWLDRDPTIAERWQIFGTLCGQVLSPNVGGLWADPGGFMRVELRQGYDSAQHLDAIGADLWPEVTERLAKAPDVAVTALIDLVGEWAALADGIPTWHATPLPVQRQAARRVVHQMATSLVARLEASPGLAVRARKQWGRNLAAGLAIPDDFLLLATDELDEKTRLRQQRRITELAERWAADGPDAVMARLAAWLPQLELVGPRSPLEAYAIGILAERVQDPEPWAEASLEYRVVPGAAAFQEALRRADTVPPWLEKASADPTFRPWAIAAGLGPGVSDAVCKHVISKLQVDDANAVRAAVLRRDRSDSVVSILLRHPCKVLRGAVALSLGPPSQRHYALEPTDQDAWERAIIGYQPREIPGIVEYGLGQALTYLAGSNPDRAAKWFRKRLQQAPRQFTQALPRACRTALTHLPGRLKGELISQMPGWWRRQLLHDGVAGDDPAWVIQAVESGQLTVPQAASALDDVSDTLFIKVAPALVKLGLEPAQAAATLMARTHLGDESILYGELLSRCAEYSKSDDPYLAAIGDAGVARYSRLLQDAQDKEHLERVFNRF